MNKKIKIIELLNLIANEEEIPRHIKYKYYQYDWSDNANDYICEDADGKRLSMFDDGYICNLCSSLNNEVEILEDNTQDIEELPEMNFFELVTDEVKIAMIMEKINLKVNQLVRAVNQIRKEKK